MRFVAAGGIAVAWLAIVGTAGAVEREHQIGLEVGVPMLVVQGANTSTLAGAGLGLHYTYGITDAVNLVSDAGWSALPLGTSGGSLSTMSNVDLGLAYVLDVLRWVPWGAAEVGGYALTGTAVGGTQVLPGVALALGCDYRFNRSWAAGIVLRQHMLFTDASTFPSLTQALLRVGYTWGW